MSEIRYDERVAVITGAGRYSRIFIGSAPGWNAPAGTTPSAEDVRDNLPTIYSTEGFKVPGSAPDA